MASPPGMSGMPGVQWRDPDLHEVIEFLQNPNSVIKANAAAYLQVLKLYFYCTAGYLQVLYLHLYCTTGYLHVLNLYLYCMAGYL